MGPGLLADGDPSDEVERRARVEAGVEPRRHAGRREQAQIIREVAATEREVASERRDEQAMHDRAARESDEEADSTLSGHGCYQAHNSQRLTASNNRVRHGKNNCNIAGRGGRR